MDYQGGGSGSSGGFGNSGFGGGMESGSQGSGSRSNGRKNYDEQTIQPCTVGMIRRARPEPGSDNALELPDGRKVHHIALVGAIKEYQENSTNVIYEIEDGTGLIDVKQWVDENDNSAKLAMRQLVLKENIFVKVVALPKYYDGNIQLVAESIRPIANGNELSCHLLDVVYTGEKLKNQGMFVAPQASLIGSSHNNNNMGSIGGRPLQMTNHDRNVKDAVSQFIRVEGDKSEIGAEIAQCIRLLGGQYGEQSVRKVVEELAAEGLIYSTASEDYYKFAMHF
jgi:replication factor A2